MRILWFANSASYMMSAETTGSQGYNGGGWIPSLLQKLKQQKEVTLGVCFTRNELPFKLVQKSVTYYAIPHHRKRWKDKIQDIIYYKKAKRDMILWPHYEEHFRRVIDDFKPDIIEIFGSELYLGLATFVAPCPVVLHVQGLLSLYIYAWLPPGVSYRSYLFQDWYPKRIYERFQLYTYWRRSCYREQQVLRHTKHVIGRTWWDEQATKLLNPERVYHYGGEILRPEFYCEPHRTLPKRLTIVTTTSNPMYKGFDYVLQTANVLKNVMHFDFDWLVYGNVNPTFPQKFTGLCYADLNIQLMGVASAATLCESLQNATLFFQPSYIENSPNAVCEAQMMGVPVVATNVGGTASLLEDGVTGFLIPANDPYMAVSRIMQLQEDRTLNRKMGLVGRETAGKRHARDAIVNGLLEIFNKVKKDGKLYQD